ncbi:hypothetical protein BYT27DRAFT_7123847 [Phlegmacium glaucopus]|nr:hypothetical protein BYT27DRAFT_7123847 [Phlegmacium glaucopus]
MRSTFRCLQATNRGLSRSRATSFIGLGRMGYQMAYNLFSKQHVKEKDWRFVICDVVPDASRAFRAEFMKQYPNAQLSIADTPEEATLNSSCVITMLPSSPQVKSVYSQIIPVLQKLNASSTLETRTLFIDSTTLDVDIAREIASSVVNAGAQMVDAPVSGGVTGAKAGTLSFLVGGTEEVFQISQPILSFMGERIIYCGPSGSGLAAKICNNLVLGVQQIVVAEAMLLGQELGLNSSVLASVINNSTGACWASSVNNPVPSALVDKSPPCERDYVGGFATSLMLKDMGLASNVAQQRKSPLPLGEAAKEIYAKAIEKRPELASRDFSSVYRFLKEQ